MVNPTILVPPTLGGDGHDSELAQLWRQLLPLDDMQAKSPVMRYLTLGKDILPTLAVLSAVAPDSPRLLKTDIASRLLVSTNFTTAVKATTGSAINQNVVTVPDSSIFPPGSYLYHVPFPGHIFRYKVKSIDSSTTIETVVNLKQIINAGDLLISVPVAIMEQPPGPSQALAQGHQQAVGAVVEDITANFAATDGTFIYGIQWSMNAPAAFDCELYLIGGTPAVTYQIAKANATGATNSIVGNVPLIQPLDLVNIFGPNSAVKASMKSNIANTIATVVIHFAQLF